MPLLPVHPAMPPLREPPLADVHQRLAALERLIGRLMNDGTLATAVPVLSLALNPAGIKGRLAIGVVDGKLYRDNGTSWVVIG